MSRPDRLIHSLESQPDDPGTEERAAVRSAYQHVDEWTDLRDDLLDAIAVAVAVALFGWGMSELAQAIVTAIEVARG